MVRRTAHRMREDRRQYAIDPPPRATAHPRACDHPGCAEGGEYRAPRSREPADGHFWFCLGHVRDYNSRWDFFAGMSADDIERYTRNNSTWQRPTWRLGARPGDDPFGAYVRDDLGLLSEVGLDARARAKTRQDRGTPPPNSPEARIRDALAVFDLPPGATEKDIKTRYKELVKRHHPDRNGGNRADEERLKAINLAYASLIQRAVD